MSASNRMRVVVTRGERFDVAEWVIADDDADADTPNASALAALDARPSRALAMWIGLAALALGVVLVIALRQRPAMRSAPLVATAGDLQAVHAGVRVGGDDVRGVRRVSVGSAIATDADGRARMRLDDGTMIVVDRATELTVTPEGIALAKGRVFIQGAPGARDAIDVGSAVGLVSGGQAGVERQPGGAAKLYAAAGDLAVRVRGADRIVHEGETASVARDDIAVAPEKAYDDWTGGLAAPWGALGGPRRAVGELWGRGASGEPASPLTIRSHDVHATIARELAETEVATTYFNAGSETITGDFRMALPPGAIVSRFATDRQGAVHEGQIALAARGQQTIASDAEVLEWAGEGWVRGSLPGIAPGATVTVIVAYTEWLEPKPNGSSWRVQYRYPMASDAAPPQIGEFSARVDAGPSQPIALASGLGATVDGQTVVLRRPDFRPTADLVVDVEVPAPSQPARLYVAPNGDDDAGATVLVRTELPEAAREDGVTVALVLDCSGSIEPAQLDAERALATAVLQGLGQRDRAIVLAADQTVHAVGPAAIGHVDAPRRKAVDDGLAALAPGGASDLGRAIEAGADALPADAPSAMVVYVGDGWPTVGDTSIERIQARLARRPNGPPRLGAVAVGPIANRFGLAALVRGSGPLFDIADSTDAAKTAVELLGDALQPTVAGVEIRFGPEVERIYPRTARAIVAGRTAFAVGRARGELPKEITFAWRDARGTHEERRALSTEKAVSEDDVARRWAEARIEEIALARKGREAVTDVAMRARLLTPWTGWLAGGASSYVPTTLATRMLDFGSGAEESFTADFATPRAAVGTLDDAASDAAEGADDERDANDDALKRAVVDAAAHAIDDAGAPIRACRDSRAQLRPELAGALDVALHLDGDGRAHDVRVHGGAGGDDDALDRCVQVVIEGLPYPASGLHIAIDVRHRIDLPPPRASLRGRTCSATSTLPLPLRRGVWLERLQRSAPASVYVDAKQTCELPTWTERRALLELILGLRDDALWRAGIAQELERAGDGDAAALLRREAVRRAKSPDELRAVKRAVVGAEHYPAGVFAKQYRAAANDRDRLAVVRRFLAIAPHDARLRRRLLALLEALGMKQELTEEVRRIRLDPFADAALLADGASALRRLGDGDGALRVFGELIERAPNDAWARAYVGDRLRREGLFDDAARVYAVLEDELPDDPSAILRLALAHAGAGRLDIATRMLARVAQTGGRAGDAQLGELAGRIAAVLLTEARGRPGLDAKDVDRLTRAALELPASQGPVVLIRADAPNAGVAARLVRGPAAARDERTPDLDAPGLGLSAFRLEAGETGEVIVRINRREELPPARASRVRVDVLVPGAAGQPPHIVSSDIDVPPTGKPVELRWSGGSLRST